MTDTNEEPKVEKTLVEKQIELLKLQIELMNIQKELDDDAPVEKWKRDKEARRLSQQKWKAKNPDYFKIWKAKHHDEIMEHRRTEVLVKVKCPFCEKELTKGNLRRHIRTIHDNMDYVANYIQEIKALVD